MAVLFSCSDRIPVQVEDCTFYFSPLSQGDKIALTQMFQGMQGDVTKALSHSQKLIKKTLKGVDGIERGDGSKWDLKFEDGLPTDESIEELYNLPFIESIIMVASQFLRGVPKEGGIVHPATGEVVEGVSIKKPIR